MLRCFARLTRLASRPRIENGFYYDFDFQEAFTEKDLKKIKKEMAKIIAQDLPLRREEVSRDEARARITALNEPYKLEILDAIKTEPITIYHVGDKWWVARRPDGAPRCRFKDQLVQHRRL